MTRLGSTYFYQYNAHGDVVSLTNSAGEVVNSYTYDPWGSITSSTEQVSNPYRYAGYQYDSTTELYYLNTRYYDSSLARFLTQDLNSGHIKKSMSINGYIYCLDNPLILTDVAGTAGKSIHLELTAKVVYDVAFNEFGYSAESAMLLATIVAKADFHTDYDPKTSNDRGRHRNMNLNPSGPPSQEEAAFEELGRAIGNEDPRALGRALHSVQDQITHGTGYFFGKHVKGPYKCKIRGTYYGFEGNNPDIVNPGSVLYGSIWGETANWVRMYLRST